MSDEGEHGNEFSICLAEVYEEMIDFKEERKYNVQVDC